MNVQALPVLTISLDDLSKDSSTIIYTSKDKYFSALRLAYWNQYLQELW